MIKLERKKDKQKITVGNKVQAAPFIRAGYEVVEDTEKKAADKKAEDEKKTATGK